MGGRGRENAEAKVERISREELGRRCRTEADLKLRAKSDPAERLLAARARRETTLTLGAIAVRLQMGSRKSFNAKLHRWRKAHEGGGK